jgi:hypothetical protein
MDRDDVVGAKAAAQYFIQLVPYVYATGDTDAMRAMSHPECTFCDGVVLDAEDLHSAGGYGVGGEVTVEEINGEDPRPGNDYFGVAVRVHQAPASELAADGEQLREDPGGTRVLVLAMQFSGDGWLVREVEVSGANA